jgi:hypothetical protein
MKQKPLMKPAMNIEDLMKGVQIEGTYRNLAMLEYAAGGDPLHPLYGAMAGLLYGEVDRLEKGGYKGHQAQFLMQMANAYATKSGYGIPGQNHGYGKKQPYAN